MNIIGYFHGYDPAACLIQDGELTAYVEEERLIRFKHARGVFPIRSIDFCLKQANLTLADVDFFAYGWDGPAYGDGRMKAFYEKVNESHPPDPATLAWQRGTLNWFNPQNLQNHLHTELRRFFGNGHKLPEIKFYPHHKAHAVTAYHFSSFDEALVFTIDGSGDHQCATLWHGKGDKLSFLWEAKIPNSLGWFYAAITELLGFEAYDGEYKVMGLAAYGRENLALCQALEKIVKPGPNGWDFVVDPKYIHHGTHTYSGRFTDVLVDLLGIPPRQGDTNLERIHEDLAFEAQRTLEETVLRLLTHYREQTGLRNLCISGGVGLNVKMNSRLHRSGLFDQLFVFPIPSDSGSSIGGAAGLYQEATGKRVAPLRHVYQGPSYTDEEIELQLRSCGLEYKVCKDISAETAELLTQGKVVAWFQGAMEGGPRALGGRSILADPRAVESRDRVNSAIKFREYWRPFCPSLTEEAVTKYVKKGTSAPYMILAFEAKDVAEIDAPAIVHVDNTMRVQTVDKETNPRFHRLLKVFEEKTGVPIVLNTSFNIKGEAIVCSPRDALRTFFSTGIDALAIGSFIVQKPVLPLPLKPEDVIR